jgi:hypothetical protein
VYRGLKEKVGPRRYRDMAADHDREAVAEEWIKGLIQDALPQPE